MKKFFVLVFSVAAVIGMNTQDLKGNMVYAANEIANSDGGSGLVPKGNIDKFKAEFAYEMAQITAKIISAPTNNIQDFKVAVAYANAQITAKVMPLIPSNQRNEFAYEMAVITTKIITEQNLDIEKAKAQLAFEIAQLTTKIINDSDKIASGKNYKDYTDFQQVNKMDNPNSQKTTVNTGNITMETYHGLLDELEHVGDRKNQKEDKVNIDGEVRYHYAVNNGYENSSGIRARLGLETKIDDDWHAYGMLEGEKKLINYNNEFKLSRLYLEGKLGQSIVKAGSFGFLMAQGNIYDSDFKGAKVDFGGPIKYSLSYGETDYTKDTTIATAQYSDFDYNLEAGVYHYKKTDESPSKNTIWTIGGDYNFSNFGLGAMYLGSSLKDNNGKNNGYVFSFNYGDLKTYRPGTYGIFAKYYNQPQDTYIAHGMNGLGSRMQGFKGYGLGMSYTLAENFVAGIEYYDLRDKTSGEKAETWWNQITHYF